MTRPENSSQTTIVTPVTVAVVSHESGREVGLHAELRYDARDPFAVRAVFLTTAEEIEWCFDRALLSEGVFEPSGDGDVRIWPCLNDRGVAETVLEVHGEDGSEAFLRVRSADVGRFLSASNTLVPPGSESANSDVDALIAEILGSA